MTATRTPSAGFEAKQERILGYVRDHFAEHRIAPTRRQIIEALGLSSTSIADYHLKALAKKGLVVKVRSSYLPAPAPIEFTCPLCGCTGGH